MKMILEKLIETKSNRDSIKELSIIANNYPCDKGYAIETWLSPNFVHIKVYDLEVNP